MKEVLSQGVTISLGTEQGSHRQIIQTGYTHKSSVHDREESIQLPQDLEV
jgi:hypothetical protein